MKPYETKRNIFYCTFFLFLLQIMFQQQKKLFVRKGLNQNSSATFNHHFIIKLYTCLKCTEGIGAACVAGSLQDGPLHRYFMEL